MDSSALSKAALSSSGSIQFHDGGSSGEGDLVDEVRTSSSSSSSSSSPSAKRPHSPLSFGTSPTQRSSSSSTSRPGAAQPPVVPVAPKPSLKTRDSYRNGPRAFHLGRGGEGDESSPVMSASGDLSASSGALSSSPGSPASPRVGSPYRSSSPSSPRSPKTSSPRSPRTATTRERRQPPSHPSAEELLSVYYPKSAATDPAATAASPPEQPVEAEKTDKPKRSRGPALKHRSISSSRLVEMSSSSLEPRRRTAPHEDSGIVSTSLSSSATLPAKSTTTPLSLDMHSSVDDFSTPERPKSRHGKKGSLGSLSRASIRTGLRKGIGIWGASDDEHEEIEVQPLVATPKVSSPTLIRQHNGGSDMSQAKTFAVGKDAFTAAEREWVTQTPNILQWSDDYGEETEKASLIEKVGGFMRELGRPAFTDAYARIDPKVANAFPLIEADKYRHYYKDYLDGGEVEAFISQVEDEHLVGPVVICCEGGSREQPRVKVLIHTKKGTDRTFIPNDGGNRIKALKALQPGLASVRFLRVKDPRFGKDMLEYEDKLIATKYKFGILYCRANQSTEDQMYNNEHGSPLFEEFLNMLGQRVRMLGFTRFRGGLDAKTDTTGAHSVYTEYRGQEIMFHVSTLLPFFPEDPQQVERKRHLGNDVVIVIFREGPNDPFTPLIIRSQFNHVYIVITPEKKAKEGKKTHYRVAMVCKQGVKPFGPSLPEPALFRKGHKFREFLLTKMVNGERAAFHAKDFVTKFSNTRRIQLHDVVERYTEGAIPAERSNIFARISRSTSTMTTSGF